MNRLLLAGPVFLACLGTACTALLLVESFDAFLALAIALVLFVLGTTVVTTLPVVPKG